MTRKSRDPLAKTEKKLESLLEVRVVLHARLATERLFDLVGAYEVGDIFRKEAERLRRKSQRLSHIPQRTLRMVGKEGAGHGYVPLTPLLLDILEHIVAPGGVEVEVDVRLFAGRQE